MGESSGSSARSSARDGRSTRWDPHRKERRRAIVAAAIEAIQESGPDPVTAQIAAKAGIPRTHVYRHFRDRSALDRAVIRTVGAELLDEIRSGMTGTGTAMDIVRRTVDAYLAWVENHQNLYRFLAMHGFVVGTTGQPAQDDAKVIAAQEIRSALALVINESSGAEPYDAEQVAVAVIGTVDATAYWWLGIPEPKPTRQQLANELAEQAWVLIERALTRLNLPTGPDDQYPPVQREE